MKYWNWVQHLPTWPSGGLVGSLRVSSGFIIWPPVSDSRGLDHLSGNFLLASFPTHRSFLNLHTYNILYFFSCESTMSPELCLTPEVYRDLSLVSMSDLFPCPSRLRHQVLLPASSSKFPPTWSVNWSGRGLSWALLVKFHLIIN